MFLFLSLFFACSDSESTPKNTTSSKNDCPKCPEEPKGSDSSLTTTEAALLAPSLEELRKGIYGFDSSSIGICKGSGKECEEFLGTTAQNLPEGEYFLHAKLMAPSLKPEGGWKVEFHRDCRTFKQTQSGETSSSNTYSKEYYISSSTKGYHLTPLAKISSPEKHGRKECDWKLIFHNANGQEEVSGSWSVPEQQ